jgi:hypothetical protein
MGVFELAGEFSGEAGEAGDAGDAEDAVGRGIA